MPEWLGSGGGQGYVDGPGSDMLCFVEDVWIWEESGCGCERGRLRGWSFWRNRSSAAPALVCLVRVCLRYVGMFPRTGECSNHL